MHRFGSTLIDETQQPAHHHCFADGDFNIAADMLFSFWLLEPLPEHHLKKAELNGWGQSGIAAV